MTVILFAAMGALIAAAMKPEAPAVPAPVYVRPTEQDFERLLRKKGLL